MKEKKHVVATKKLTRIVLVPVLAFGLAACAKRLEFPVSTMVPAAVAKAKITKDDNGNSQIRLRVEHLAPPERLTPPRRIYVTWLQLPAGYILNLGALKVDKNLNGELNTVTPYPEFRLLVTAEDSIDVVTPGGQQVMTTEMMKAR